MDVIICCVRARNTKKSSFRMFLTKFANSYQHIFVDLNKGPGNSVSKMNQMSAALKIINFI
jgi:hypothetical protein